MRIQAFLCALLGAIPLAAEAEPFWGDTASSPADTDPAGLAPGSFIWQGGAEPDGPIIVLVSLSDQLAYVYRDGVRIGVSTLSTGRQGREVPTGVFTVLQKDRGRRPGTYDNSRMPITERLTWTGIALHAGGLPDYPCSHGCVHLPTEFARQLFEITDAGLTVVISDDPTAPREVLHSGLLTPVEAMSGSPVERQDLESRQQYRWHPEKSSVGPVSVLVSAADSRLIVLRNGVEIGRAKAAMTDPGRSIGTHAYVLNAHHTVDDGASVTQTRRWTAIALPNHAPESGGLGDANALARVRVPKAFAEGLDTVLEPGATLVVTDAPATEQTTGPALDVIASGPPPGTRAR